MEGPLPLDCHKITSPLICVTVTRSLYCPRDAITSVCGLSQCRATCKTVRGHPMRLWSLLINLLPHDPRMAPPNPCPRYGGLLSHLHDTMAPAADGYGYSAFDEVLKSLEVLIRYA